MIEFNLKKKEKSISQEKICKKTLFFLCIINFANLTKLKVHVHLLLLFFFYCNDLIRFR